MQQISHQKRRKKSVSQHNRQPQPSLPPNAEQPTLLSEENMEGIEDRLREINRSIKKAHSRSSPSRVAPILISLLFVLAAALIIRYGPEFTAFVTYEQAFNETLHISTPHNLVLNLQLQHPPSSVRLSGIFTGTGSATAHLLQNGTRLLVALVSVQSTAQQNSLTGMAEADLPENRPPAPDNHTGASVHNTSFPAVENETQHKISSAANSTSAKEPTEGMAQEITFQEVCTETCSLTGISQNITLLLEVHNGTLNLTKLSYTVTQKQPESSKASNACRPFWNSSTESFDASRPLTINLSQYFVDPSGARLTYLAVGAEGVNITLQGELCTIATSGPAEVNITLFASNLNFTVSKQITIMSKATNPENQTQFTPPIQEPLNKSAQNETFSEFLKPVWDSQVQALQLRGGLRLNLYDYLSSPGKANLTFAFRQVQNITITLNNNFLTLLPASKLVANRTLTLFASNGLSQASKDILLVIDTTENNTTLNQTVSNANLTANQSAPIQEGLIQGPAQIGKPVHWTKWVRHNTTQVELPEEAQNITVSSFVGMKKTKVSDTRMKRGNAKKGLKAASAEPTLPLEINVSADSLEITYETDAPTATVQALGPQATRIVISSPLHYSNVLSFVDIGDTQAGAIRLYSVSNSSKTDITSDPAYNVTLLDLNNNSLVDRVRWLTPHLSNQTFEISIIILNVQSYPMVGGSWTVAFNTTGKANLTIFAANGTTYGDSSPHDLQFLSLKCGNVSFSSFFNGTRVFVSNYECNTTALHTVGVLTTGRHTQAFRFGDQTEYAHNWAGWLNVSLRSPPTGTVLSQNNVTLRCNVTLNGTGRYLKNVSLYLNSSNGFKLNRSVIFGPINASGSLGSKLLFLYHLNNDSSLGESQTRFNDSSGFKNNGTCPVGNCPNVVAGKFGKARKFNGTTQVISGGTKNSLTNLRRWTIAAWIYPTSIIPGHDYIVAKADVAQNGYWLEGTSSSNQFFVEMDWTSGSTFQYSTANSFATSDLNHWMHLAATWNGSSTAGSWRIYKNGVDITDTYSVSGTIGAQCNDVNCQILIGNSDPGRLDHPFNGTIDEVAIWNRTLSATEIKSLWNLTRTRYQANFSLPNLRNRTYKWNCLAADNQSFSRWAVANWTFKYALRHNPTITSGPTLSPSLPNVTSRLNCSFKIGDIDAGDTLYANYTWYNKTGSSWTAKFKGRISVTNNTFASVRLTGGGNLTKGRNWNCSIRAYDGTNYSAAKSVNVTIKNWPARRDAQFLTPSTAYKGTKLSGNATCVDLDPADTITAWCQLYNTSVIFGSRYTRTVTNNTKTNICNVTASQTKKGQTWKAEFWCGDGTANSTKTNVTNTILNTAPYFVTNPSLSPTSPNTSSRLNCSFKIGDTDVGDTLYANYTWYNKTGSSWTAKFKGRISVTNNTFASVRLTGGGNLTKGRNWNCSIRAYDGTNYSAAKSVNVTVKNWPARRDAQFLTPSAAYKGTKLSGNATCVDLDPADTITAWCQLYNTSAIFGSRYTRTVTNNTKTNICNVTASQTKKGQTWKAEFWCGDGTANSTKTNVTNTILNTAPYFVTNPSISPTSPNTSSRLNCSFKIGDTDVGDTLYANYTWYNKTGSTWTAKYKGRISVTNNTYASIRLTGAGNITKGRNWNCSIQPYDSTDYGTIKSVNVTINNWPSRRDNQWLTPTSTTINTKISGNTTCVDLDPSDTITAWCQLYNTSVIFGTKYKRTLTNNTKTNICNVSATWTKKGQTWNAEFWCGDGTTNSTKANATSTIGNSAPYFVTNPSISPTSPNSSSRLNCSFKIGDIDVGDTLYANFTWYNKTGSTWTAKFKGRISVTNNTLASVRLTGGTNLTKGRNWNCSIKGYDGTNYSTAKSVNVTVKNWPARRDAQFLTPSTAYKGTKLSGNATCVDLDPSDTITAWCQLYNTTAIFGSRYTRTVTNNTKTNICNVTASWTKKGQTWKAEFWCGDGTANSTKANATNTILNTAPYFVTNPSISPTSPNTSSRLNCSFKIGDVDVGDTLYANYTWYNKTGSTWTAKFKGRISVTNNTYASIRLTGSGNLTKGRNWNCTIQPYDGTDYGTLNSANVTIKNWPTRKDSQTLTPSTAYRGTKLSGNATCVDLDPADTITAWCQLYNTTAIFGSRYTRTVTNNTKTNICNVTASQTKKGQTWNAEFWCGDSTFNSTKSNSSVTILNSLPSFVRSPALGPKPAYGRQKLRCNFSISDVDVEPNLYENFTWYNWTGSSWTAKFKGRMSVLNNTLFWLNLSALNVSNGNKWNCSILPYDGTGYGSWQSDNVTVQQTPLTYLRSPATGSSIPDTNVTLRCNVSSFGATALKNISLWTNKTGTWSSYKTIDVREIQPSSRKLAVLYHFDNDSSVGENQTRIYDWSGNGIYGVVQGGIGYNASGKIKSGYQLDGVTGTEIKMSGLPISTAAGDNITVAFWMYWYGTGGQMPFGWKDDYYDLYIASYTAFGFNTGGGDEYGVSTAGPLLDHKWAHIVAVFPNSYPTTEPALYINGNKQSLSLLFGTRYARTVQTNALISGWTDTDSYKFAGLIDEFAIWNRTLTNAEISALYNLTRKNYQANFTLTSLAAGYYKWNCLASDNASQSRWAASNWTFRKAAEIPGIKFVSPTPPSGNTTSRTYAYLNTSIRSNTNTSAFFDWNRTLVGYWSFDYYNSSGVYDNSSYRNFGTFAGGLGTSNITTGKYGKGLKFDGVDDYLNMGSANALRINHLNNQVTIGAWIYWGGQAGSLARIGGFQGYWGDYALWVYSDGRILFEVDGQHGNTLATSGGDAISQNSWYYVAGTFVDGSMKIYVNGVQKAQMVPAYYPPTEGTDPLEIGNAENSYFKGKIDEVRIFKRALSPEEINASYNSGKYRLFHNFTGLGVGNYSYSAWAINTEGGLNRTATRTFNRIAEVPGIKFVSPTPPSGNVTSRTYAYLNTSIRSNTNTSAFFDWNRTLAGYWSFDYYNTTGVFDNSSYRNFGAFHGTGFGTSNITAGRYGKALKFDGLADYVDSGVDLSWNNNNSVSISFWMKPNTVTDLTAGVLGKVFPVWEWSIYQNNDDIGLVYWDNVGSNSNGMDFFMNNILSIGQWTNVVYTWNRSQSKFYANGVLSATNDATNPALNQNRANNVQIGGHIYTWGDTYFNGAIDEVRFFRRVLSPEEVNASYNAGKYRLYHNFTGLGVGNYTYSAWAINTEGGVNRTATRTFKRTAEIPGIKFVSPTPPSGNVTSRTYAYLNTSIRSNTNTSAFFDWNRTLVGYWSFDYYNTTGVFDNSSYRNFGKFYGGLSTSNITNGKYGKGLKFDGADDSIAVSSTNYNSITVSAWFYRKQQDSANADAIWGAWVWDPNPQNYEGYDLRFFPGSPTILNWYVTTTNGVTKTFNGASYDLGSSQFNKWYQAVGTYDSATGVQNLYINGVLQATSSHPAGNTIVPLVSYADMRIGYSRVNSGYFNGTIDEVRVFSRALSAQEVNASYNAGKYRLFHNFTGLGSANYTYAAWAINTEGGINRTATRNITTGTNSPPTVSSGPTLPPYTGCNAKLVCAFTITDTDTGETLYANFTWYNKTGSSWTKKFKGQVGVTKNVQYQVNLSAANTTCKDTWNCSIRPYDSLVYGTEKSANVYINNTPPQKANLSYPTKADSFFTNRRPTFNWTSVTDPDSGDSIKYHLQVALDYAFSSLIFNNGTLTTNRWNSSIYLLLSTQYFWRVIVNDSVNVSRNNSVWNFTIQPYVAVKIYNKSISFSNILNSKSANTSGGSPGPFKLQNDGNVETNVSTSATALYSTVTMNKSYYQFKARATAESNSFSSAASQMTWANMSQKNLSVVRLLNYTDTKDESYVDIRVQVPSSEPPATRNSNVTFWLRQS